MTFKVNHKAHVDYNDVYYGRRKPRLFSHQNSSLHRVRSVVQNTIICAVISHAWYKMFRKVSDVLKALCAETTLFSLLKCNIAPVYVFKYNKRVTHKILRNTIQTSAH